mmetsp:Transcript_73197/g.174446  ORF Transcript_73197/g.174446 Transcript_73197/m.174446 type:complete len:105 (+) Transcript_73197:118-432(+)|eukprot:CAMPEP_0178402730 /NCGR_PEP_ID=MMETSP0689_2-20121128/16997_1 /TAXON_ID=160604 /ORGANISM="Amphidinium massartii, Strain CS-259" /LENGTH=104 /DNA_ID=CAMNT_0020023649 /DNA_START=123 /DNA_END=437 /DNA_ORIENTATION=-
MAARRGSTLLAALLCVVGMWCLCSISSAYVPSTTGSLRGSESEVMSGQSVASAAALGVAVASVPQAASAATAGYAVLQVGWALFFIALGPAFLLWVYFNKPELL